MRSAGIIASAKSTSNDSHKLRPQTSEDHGPSAPGSQQTVSSFWAGNGAARALIFKIMDNGTFRTSATGDLLSFTDLCCHCRQMHLNLRVLCETRRSLWLRCSNVNWESARIIENHQSFHCFIKVPLFFLADFNFASSGLKNSASAGGILNRSNRHG